MNTNDPQICCRTVSVEKEAIIKRFCLDTANKELLIEHEAWLQGL
jgi:hypothetical protein